MPNQTFVFKQFSIHQEKCSMKVGTDSVLLGSWVEASTAKSILDIGTGTGVIAIMLAQKSDAEIDALDIDVNACEQAEENARYCKWNARIKIHHSSIQHFALEQTKKYDLIVSNPPYFFASSKSPEEGRTLARHNDMLPYAELLDSVRKLLKDKGKFAVILPKKEAIMFRELGEKKGLYLSKLLRVKTKQLKEDEKRHVMQFEFNPQSFSESTIVIEKEERHEYTDEYKELTRDYYINF